MKKMKLSGKSQAEVLLDDEDFATVREWTWYLNSAGYAVRSAWVPTEKKQKTLMLHRFILGLDFGDQRRVDHRDRNTLNNQRSNLRIGTQALNQQNYNPRKNASSKYRGVSWVKAKGLWSAYGQVDRKLHHLGLYDDEEEAAAVARAWRLEHMPWAID